MKVDPLCTPGSVRIAVLGSTYPRTPSDHEVPWLREWVKRLAAREYEVLVIAPAYQGLDDHVIDGVPVRRFRYAPGRWEILTHGEGAPNKLKKNPILKLLTLSYLMAGVFAVWKICRQERIDILHVHWPFPHWLMALLPARLNGVVSTCHSAEFALAAPSKLACSLLAANLRQSDAIMANSAHTAKLVRDLAGLTARIIPWGATIKLSSQEKVIPQEVPLLLFSGRLIERKGVNFLLRAMPLILAHRKVRLVITGDGHCRAEWENLARELGLHESVTFAGFVSNDELSSLFRSCSVYVHPAIYDSKGDTEGQGVVLVEALSNWRPVVASKVGGIVDVIKDGETGLLVPEKNPEAIAKAVLRLLENPEYATRLGEQGYAYVRDYFDWDRIMDQYDAIYAESVSSPRPPAIEERGVRAVTTQGKTMEKKKPSIFGKIRRLLPWVAIGCVVLALVPRMTELRQCIERLSPAWLAPALALCLAYWFFNAGVWSWILESLGHPLPYLIGVRAWLTSESLRWLPGGVWKFASRVDAARNLGIPLGIASISLPLELAAVVISWVIVGSAGILLSGLASRFLTTYANLLLPATIVAMAGMVVLCLVWPILYRQAWVRSRLEQVRTILKLKLDPRVLLRSECLYIGLNILHGVGLWLMLAGMGYGQKVSLAAAVGANAVGWLTGTFAMVVPGGIGVRESATALLLSPLMPWQEAALAAVLWRALQIVAELISLAPWVFFSARPKPSSFHFNA